jgi:hypothetical protein
VENETLLPLGTMARKVRVPSTWLRKEAEEGRVPHLNAGGQLLFNSSIVEKLLLSMASQQKREACAHV